jgi:oxaloacetate decarboxylase gamma subunit
METNLILEGFKFMALGMGTVFMFLIILIFVMNMMSKIIHKYFPEPQVDVNADINASTGAKQKDNKKVIAAITAAIAHHRQG